MLGVSSHTKSKNAKSLKQVKLFKLGAISLVGNTNVGNTFTAKWTLSHYQHYDGEPITLDRILQTKITIDTAVIIYLQLSSDSVESFFIPTKCCFMLWPVFTTSMSASLQCV